MAQYMCSMHQVPRSMPSTKRGGKRDQEQTAWLPFPLHPGQVTFSASIGLHLHPVQDSNSVLSSGCKACIDPFRNHFPHPTQPFHEVSLVNILTVLKPQLSRELTRQPLLSNNSAFAQPDTSHPTMLGKCGDFHINLRNAK